MSRPKKPGWYWLWPDNGDKPQPVQVVFDGKALTVQCYPFVVPVMLTAAETWGDEIVVPTTRGDDA